jgi:CRISPR-associated endonuclease/helicase Cas3
MMLLAKSPERGGLTLREHTEHVIAAAVRMAAALGFNERVARCGAVLHDLGKAHPFFQAVLRDEISADDRMRRAPHRHELSSLLLLPLFDEADWPALIEMIVGHHKSVRRDRSERGLMDLLHAHFHSPDHLFERHSEDWEDWMPQAVSLAHSFGVTEIDSVSLDEARRALDACITYCRKPEKGWSEWRGLLMAADHFASGYQHETDARLGSLYRVPDVEAAYGPASRFATSALYPLSLREDAVRDERPHTLVIAPTGAGKTNFLLRRCRNRVFYTLPTRRR